MSWAVTGWCVRWQRSRNIDFGEVRPTDSSSVVAFPTGYFGKLNHRVFTTYYIGLLDTWVFLHLLNNGNAFENEVGRVSVAVRSHNAGGQRNSKEERKTRTHC